MFRTNFVLFQFSSGPTAIGLTLPPSRRATITTPPIPETVTHRVLRAMPKRTTASSASGVLDEVTTTTTVVLRLQMVITQTAHHLIINQIHRVTTIETEVAEATGAITAPEVNGIPTAPTTILMGVTAGTTNDGAAA